MLTACLDCQKQISSLVPCSPPLVGKGVPKERERARWATGLAIAALVIGMGLLISGCSSKDDKKDASATETLKAPGAKAEDLISISLNEKYGYINGQGKMMIPPRFERVENFAANGLALVKENGKYGYIDAKGKMVIPPKFEVAGNFAANGLAWAEENGKRGYINAKGEAVVPPKLEGVVDTNDFATNGLARAMKNEKWGYINAKGEMVISPRFEKAWNFAANGLALVEEEIGGKWGYINAKGEMVIPPRFDDALDFAVNGLAWVKENGKRGYIDAKGQTVLSIEEADGYEVLKNDHGEIIWPQK